MRLNGHSKRRLLEGLGIAAAATVLRLFYLAPYPTGWDDVDFALALTDYDMSRMQPHFPGYPVYIAAAQLFYHWLPEPFLALTVLSAVAGGLTVLPLWLLFNRMGTMRNARLAVLLYTTAPLPLISSIQPMSDSLGACIAAWLAYFAWCAAEEGHTHRKLDASRGVVQSAGTWWLVLSSITLGLLLGVRISYVALAALWVWAMCMQLRLTIPLREKWRRLTGSAAAAAGVCIVWLSGLVVTEGGFDKFFSLAVAFTGGHFSDWGGTYHTDASLMHRLMLLIFRQSGAAGLGTVWQEYGEARWIPTVFVGISVLGGLVWAVRRKQKFQKCSIDNDFHLQRNVIFLVIWVVPYFIWVLLAQNIEKPRHILPLLPPVMYLAAAGVNAVVSEALAFFGRHASAVSKTLSALLGGLWICGTLAVSMPLLKQAHSVESPMVQLAHFVSSQVPADNSLIFTWEEQRVLKLLDSSHTVIRLRHWEDLRTEALQYDIPQKIYATNALIEGLDHPVEELFHEVAVFRGNPWIYPTYSTIRLYEGTSRLYDELR